MKFAAIIEYSPDKSKIAEVRPSHRTYLAGLKAQGKIAITGPFTDDSGALIVLEADTAEEAESLLRSDPFSQNGVFLRWVIRPWNPIMANRDLLPS
jgi:uncharacterized protein YciI